MDYVSVEMPCHPEVRHWLMKELPSHEGKPVLNRSSSMGKVIMESLESKRHYVYKRQDWPQYKSSVIILMPHHIAKEGRMGLGNKAVIFINTFVKKTVYEHLYTYLRISMVIDQYFNIRTGITLWMTAMEVNDDIKSMETCIRAFQKHRTSLYPNLKRKRGRPKKNSEKSSI